MATKIYKSNEIHIYEGTTLRKKIFANGFETPFFDDLFPSKEWTAPAGSPAPDLVAYTIAGLSYNFLSFDGGSTNEYMTNTYEITHGIDIDSLNNDIILPEIHTHGFASTTGSGIVKMFFDAIYMPQAQAPFLWFSDSVLIPINANNQYWHKIQGKEITKPSTGFDIGDKIILRVGRVPGDAQDTYASDWAFMQAAFHMPFNSNGSRQRYIK